MDENPPGAEVTSETDPAAKTKRALFWKLKNRSRAQVNLDVYEEEVALPEPKPGHLFTPLDVSSMPELPVVAPPSALRVEIRPEEEEEEVEVGERGYDAVRYSTRGVFRRVWRRLVGGQ
jgi:hypothetical protein